MTFWVNPRENIRLFGGEIRRGSEEWDLVYRKRWSVERVFSRWKVEGRLNDHRFRQGKTIRLYSMLQMLALQAVPLTQWFAFSWAVCLLFWASAPLGSMRRLHRLTLLHTN